MEVGEVGSVWIHIQALPASLFSQSSKKTSPRRTGPLKTQPMNSNTPVVYFSFLHLCLCFILCFQPCTDIYTYDMSLRFHLHLISHLVFFLLFHYNIKALKCLYVRKNASLFYTFWHVNEYLIFFKLILFCSTFLILHSVASNMCRNASLAWLVLHLGYFIF